jgi:hypothetical protein
VIGVDTLDDGVWYDGFLWYDGRQKRTDTMRWMGRDKVFTLGGARYMHTADPKAGRVMTFEPNVISIGLPAS